MVTDNDNTKILNLSVSRPRVFEQSAVLSTGEEYPAAIFYCSVGDAAIEDNRYDFEVVMVLNVPLSESVPHLAVTETVRFSDGRPVEPTKYSPYKQSKKNGRRLFVYKEGFVDIGNAIHRYTLTQKERSNLDNLILPQPDPSASQYFGELLKKILENIGYEVNIEFEDYYFPAPTSMGLVSPVFSLGLQKEVEPTEIIEKYETTFIYLSHEKPQSKAQIQLRLFDSIPEERLKELQRSFKDNLSPYGLKCLYLAVEECSYNKRNPWFILDTNKCLDLMGYKRNKKNVHQTNNKKRLLKEFEALTKINFNIERREPKGKGNKDKAIKFQAPLLSITGKFEEWEVERDKPIETGKLIKENVQIFLHPEIYKYINNWYTIIPKAFLTIDAGGKPHAILLYSYIANQWRIGLNQYQGTIKQSMRQLLDGAGLLSRLPKRANQQRAFVKKIKDDLKWLKSQPVFWIKNVSFEAKSVPTFDQTVIITMEEDHPLRSLIKKQIKSE